MPPDAAVGAGRPLILVLSYPGCPSGVPRRVQQPDGRRWEHHVVRMRHLAVAAVVDDQKRVLMMWRHRFVTDTWGWELPMGLIEEDETPERAAAREVEEETGRRVEAIKPLGYAQPANGITDAEQHVFRADGATYMGPLTEANESDRIEWIPLSQIRGMIDRREIVSSGATLGPRRISAGGLFHD
ncbi:NUDIX hydrolase [Streptomyces sp. PSKA28]|uniref:NUDIX hydrolase n=1 Tax=Streptomyces himalayensis subsp. himalayensis TaxID=2756131 RepID=A0A7W0ICY0_9ACTN|nr:NUDIX hydrolase [Streptomyces himalayensis subsp. himalayensis]